MDEIFEIRIWDKDDNESYVMLPTSKYKIMDAMEQDRIGENFSVQITDCDLVPELSKFQFKGTDIGDLQALAKRIAEMQEEYEYNIYAYRAFVFDLDKSADVSELLRLTYDMSSVPVYPCRNDSVYGEIVLENEMLPELEGVSDEVYKLLSPEKAGKRMREIEDGVYIEGYLVVKSSYEHPELDRSELPKPDDWLFRFIVKSPDNPKSKEILDLPASDEELAEVAAALGTDNIDKCKWECESSVIPVINTGFFKGADGIREINEIAKQLSELSREDLIKFKALADAKFPDSFSEVKKRILSLDSYEIDTSIQVWVDYASKLFSKMLPPEFDRTLLKFIESNYLSQEIAERNGVSFTPYGVISAEGRGVYDMPTRENEQEESENFTIKM